ncbi:MAG: hypothetical protein ABIG93_00430 [archaeon]|nr:hypothetical protein [Nanoarchaeota archaeon]
MSNFIKKAWIKLHLNYICKHCPYDKWHTRDIKHTGKCWWNSEWKKGNYDDVPMWMGIRNFVRLRFLNKPIKICFHGKTYKGYKWKRKK